MNLNVSNPLYVKIALLVFAVLLLWLSGLKAFEQAANYMLDTGKFLLGAALVSIQGNAQAVAKEVADARAKADAVVKEAE